MIGHAVSNVVPVIAANRIGTECGQRFYGHSFICDERGDLLAEFGANERACWSPKSTSKRPRHRAAFASSASRPSCTKAVEDIGGGEVSESSAQAPVFVMQHPSTYGNTTLQTRLNQ
jgi:N-carbamoylputrescine amidase